MLRDLVDKSDVLIENFRPGTLEKWGLGWADLSESNPGLIMLRVSGFGQESSYGSRPLFGRAAEAMSGLLGMSGFPDGPPVHSAFAIGDLMTSMLGALGIASSLYRRRETGRGELIDMSLLDAPFRAMEWLLPVHDHAGQVPQRAGNRSPLGRVVADVYSSSDGVWMSVSAGTNSVITKLLIVVGGQELAHDPRFATHAARQQDDNHERLLQLLGEWIGARTSDEVMDTFLEAGAVVSPAYDIAHIAQMPYFYERELIVSVEDPELGTLRMPGIVPKLTNEPTQIRWGGPAIGQHNADVYSELLGLTREDMDGLERDGII
jgi:crotonobetainyl-CoA:carnitine CoA-transferase CaiB-like acyl-CoA transferase